MTDVLDGLAVRQRFWTDQGKAVEAAGLRDGCRSYVKCLSLFAVIWARVSGSASGSDVRFGSVSPGWRVADAVFLGLRRERRVVSPFAGLERGRSGDLGGRSRFGDEMDGQPAAAGASLSAGWATSRRP